MANNKNRDAILAPFLLGSAAIAAFSEAIYAAAISSARDAYDAAIDDLGIEADDTTLPDEVLRVLAQRAKDDAASIVSTYNESITRAAANYAGDDLHGALVAWADARAAWKSEQIASYTTGYGYSAGMGRLVSDILDGSIDLPDGVEQSDLVVVVEPPEAAEIECEMLVDGSPYPIDDAADVLDVFPLHQNCPHFSYVTFRE
jgi:hypothetical protein